MRKHFKIVEIDFNGYSIYRIKERHLFGLYWSYLTNGYYSPLEYSSYLEFRSEHEAYIYLLTYIDKYEGVIHTPKGKMYI